MGKGDGSGLWMNKGDWRFCCERCKQHQQPRKITGGAWETRRAWLAGEERSQASGQWLRPGGPVRWGQAGFPHSVGPSLVGARNRSTDNDDALNPGSQVADSRRVLDALTKSSQAHFQHLGREIRLENETTLDFLTGEPAVSDCVHT
jgi:hypothetical protein